MTDQEPKKIFSEKGQLVLEDQTIIDFSVSSATGAYFFIVTNRENTIGNFLKAAQLLSREKQSPIVFNFSGHYVSINSNSDGTDFRAVQNFDDFQIPESEIADEKKPKWLIDRIKEHLTPPTEEQKYEFIEKWLDQKLAQQANKHDEQLENFYPEPDIRSLFRYLAEARQRKSFDNLAEMENSVLGIMEIAWHINSYADETTSEDVQKAQDMRHLGCLLYEDSSEQAAYFRDADEALEAFMIFVYHVYFADKKE